MSWIKNSDGSETYKPDGTWEPLAIDGKVSKEMDDYHKNAVVQINISKEMSIALKKELS